MDDTGKSWYNGDMSFITDMFSKVSSVLPGKSTNSVVGIDIGTSSIKIAQVKLSGGKIELETYGELSLGAYANQEPGRATTLAPDVIAKALGDLLRESNVTTRAAALSIQSQATLVFILEIPQVSQAELATLIPNEARKYIPVPLTEVALDWYVVPEKVTYAEEAAADARKKMEIVVVAVRNETLSQYKQISELAKLDVRGEEIEIFSAIRSAFHREISPTLVIDYGASTTKVSVVEYGVVRAHRVINRGSSFVTDALARSMNIKFEQAEALKKTVGMTQVAGQETVAETIAADTQYIVNEIQTALLEYERSSHQAVTKIILAGGGSAMPGFKDKIQATFGVETVMADPFSKTEAPAFMQPVLAKAGPEFTIAVGLALKEFA